MCELITAGIEFRQIAHATEFVRQRCESIVGDEKDLQRKQANFPRQHRQLITSKIQVSQRVETAHGFWDRANGIVVKQQALEECEGGYIFGQFTEAVPRQVCKRQLES